MLMSAEVGPRKFEMEKAAIDAAYRDHIRKLFDAYYFSTGGNIDKHDALAKFKGNIEALRRAHVQAISVFSEHDQM